MIIEIKGASFENYGAWLMLTSVLQRLDEIAPNALIVLAREVKPRDNAVTSWVR